MLATLLEAMPFQIMGGNIFRIGGDNGDNSMNCCNRDENKSVTNERGASMVEYAVMVALIAVVVIGAVRLLGTNISTKMNESAVAVGAN
jgi:pilus assembly protein Flp/PilA